MQLFLYQPTSHLLASTIPDVFFRVSFYSLNGYDTSRTGPVFICAVSFGGDEKACLVYTTRACSAWVLKW